MSGEGAPDAEAGEDSQARFSSVDAEGTSREIGVDSEAGEARENAPVENAPVEDAPVEDAPVEDAPVEDAPVEDAPVEDALVEDALLEDGADAAAPVSLDVMVTELAAERDEYLDALRRLQADFDNYRKRTTRHQAEVLERAGAALVERLLPVLDALDLALAHAGERASGGATDLEPAFVQIGNLLRDVLAKEGLERIDATGVGFDPTVHDAVAQVADDEPREEGDVGAAGPAVVETLRAGYRLKGQVLRPAMVKVRG